MLFFKKENINTKEIKSNTEDKTNVVSNNKGNESTNNKNNSENIVKISILSMKRRVYNKI